MSQALIRQVDTGWGRELMAAINADSSEVRIGPVTFR